MAEQEDLKILVSISPDELKAYITLYKGDGDIKVSKDEMLRALALQKVIFGINEKVIEQYAENPMYNEPFCVAEGRGVRLA
jgi:uncharacterized protein (DUF342 family)